MRHRESDPGAGAPGSLELSRRWVMNHIEMEIRIEAPVDHVWAYLCDPSHMDDWSIGKWEFGGPTDRVGARLVQTSRMMGIEGKTTWTVVEVESGRLLHLRSDPDPGDMTFRTEPEGDATRLALETDYELPKHMPGFLKDLMSRSFVERNMRHQMENLKAFAEAAAPIPA
jgi:uncharacterized protein YndB with AHSA1/START domain